MIMNKFLAIRSLCVKTLLPAAAALVFAATGGHAFAAVSDGVTAIENKLTPQFIPTLKAPTTTVKAKAADLLLAISLALQDSSQTAATAEDIASAALAAELGKVRADKDKIAGQIIATIAASKNLDAATLAKVAAAVFNSNSTDPNVKHRLSAAGQAAAVVGALKSAGSASAGNNIGNQIAQVYTGDLATLFGNTLKALGKTTTSTVAATFENYVNGTFTQKPAQATEAFVAGVADKVAATNPVGVGALYGGLVLNNPGGAFDSDPEIQTLLTDVLADKKLPKAVGEIIANAAVGVTPAGKVSLSQSLNTGRTAPTQALITQGLLRAGTAADVSGILGASAIAALDPLKYGAVLVTGTGADLQKVDAIVDNLTAKVGSDVKKQTTFGIAVINAVSLSNPAAAETAAKSIFDGAAFVNSPGTREQFGKDTVGKIKTYAGAGYVVVAIVKADPTQTVDRAAFLAGEMMVKGNKAATEIAHQVSALAATGDKIVFATKLANNAPTKVQDVAMGVSITDPLQAGAITAAAVTHNPAVDKASLAKAATIGAAVAGVVDEEATADIGQALANVMSDKGTTANKPVKLSLAATLATGLAKALQSKPGVKLANRMDELGELAAAMTQKVLGKSTTDAAQAKLIATIGSNILKALSKTPALSDNPNPLANPSHLVAVTQTLKADLWEARDIAGSIAETIFRDPTLTAGQKTALLGTGIDTAANQGPLLSAFLKLAGKKGSATYQAVIQAFVDVRNNQGALKFENGVDLLGPDKETDHVNG